MMYAKKIFLDFCIAFLVRGHTFASLAFSEIPQDSAGQPVRLPHGDKLLYTIWQN